MLVASATFHGQTALTYSCEQDLVQGQIVKVPLRSKEGLGIIERAVPLPNFPTKKILEILNLPPLSDITLRLINWLKSYYPAPLGVIVQQFLPKSLSSTQLEKPTFVSVNTMESIKLPPLTAEQKNVLKVVSQTPGSCLLHGETGSGKTRVYLELALRSLGAGRSVLILTPEISLTSQLISFFEANCPYPLMVIHSQLRESERRAYWLSIIKSAEPLVVIGARSALFSPLKNIGLIVVDEAHETSYKQEQSPYYSALRVAGQLANLHRGTFLMGSATPSVTEYYIAQNKKIPILRMKELAKKPMAYTNKQVELINLTDRSQFTLANHISDSLVEAISQALKDHQQSLLLLNRRGTARVIVCQNCGWQALCPHCDLPLTYHGDSHTCRCHVCGHQESSPTACPVCGSTYILFKSVGTKAVADELRRIFPEAVIGRYDADTKKADSFNLQYTSIKEGKVDILVGTQTLAKGLDLPRLSVVGVVVADTGLYLPDYTANERTYQLIYQVIGRIGRGHIAGKAFVQTYDPNNPTITAAITKDWQSFYRSQLQERQTFLFPPFCFLLKVSCRRASLNSARAAALRLAQDLKAHALPIQVIGPSPAFHEKLGGKFQWQLIIKAKSRAPLLRVIDYLPSGWSHDIDPIDLL